MDTKIKITYGCSGLYTIRALPFNEHTKEEIAEDLSIQLQQTGIPDQFDTHIHLTTDTGGDVESIKISIGYTTHTIWADRQAVDIVISDSTNSPRIRMLDRY